MPVMRVEMLAGKTKEQKQQLAKELTETYCRIVDGRPEAVYLVIEEVEAENWALGGTLLSGR